MCDICRRSFLRGAVAASALVAAPAAFAAPGNAAAKLPARGEFIIRNALVMTMDAALGDIADGAVHVKNGAIVAVGKDVKAPGARVIEGKGMIVMPGLVETHWHCWNTIYRSFSGDIPANGYFPTVARFGQQMTPDDTYQSVRLSVAEAINSGTTFVHDWAHNMRSKAHGDADIRAIRESGIRARFSCGWAQGLSDKQLSDQGPIEAFAAEWKSHSNEGLIQLGMAWRGLTRVEAIPEEIYRKEIDNARRLGLPVTLHCGSSVKRTAELPALIQSGLLGKDVQIVHGLAATADDIAAIKKSGATVSLSPGSELRIGYGLSIVGDYLDAGVPVGASIDTSALAGSSNLFAVLKLLRDAENAKHQSEFKLGARRVLEIGTIEGARSMGLDDKIGSLKPGKRADLIMINPNTLNMGVVTDPAHSVLEATTPENIDTVVVDGRILKRGGKLTAMSPQTVVKEAQAALAGIRQRANWR